MGCGSVQYNSTTLKEKKIALKPYPDDINGINDKVANSFNTFLRNHGANPKPLYKDRPKLNFELKESKPDRQSITASIPNNLDIFQETTANLMKNSDELFLASISENKSEDSMSKFEERSFFIPVPQESRSPEPIQPQRGFRFSINLQKEDDIKELNDLENEVDEIMTKYLDLTPSNE